MEFIVTTIGGGTGSFSVLSGLRQHPNIHIQAIVSMMDSGGDSGRLRDEFGVLPPGDIRRCLVALSEETEIMRELFSYRFTDAPLQGRSFGNLFFLALAKSLGSQQMSLEALSKILKIKGQVIAVTWDDAHICARLADGTILKGEANIDVPLHDPSIPIDEVYLEPAAKSNVQAIEAIGNADFILLGPGDLYTSSIPNLLVEGISEAIQASGAPLIYVSNLMTKLGETNGYSVSRHIEEIVRYGAKVPDVVLVHKGTIPENLAKKYKLEQAHEVEIDLENIDKLGVKCVKFGNIMSNQSLVRHDPERVGNALVELFDELSV